MNRPASTSLLTARRCCLCAAALLALLNPARSEAISLRGAEATASISAPGFPPSGAIDGDRFSPDRTHAWQPAAGGSNWWWQVHFDSARKIGAILQITGDHPFVLRNAPSDYTWQWSADGQKWRDFASTKTAGERRSFRLHRFPKAERVSFLRLQITATYGDI